MFFKDRIPFMISIAAPRGSGKSYLLADRLNAELIDAFDDIEIFCTSICFNDDYYEFRNHPKIRLHWDFSVQDVEMVIQRKQDEMRDFVAEQRGETPTRQAARTRVRIKKRKPKRTPKENAMLKWANDRWTLDTEQRVALQPSFENEVLRQREASGFFAFDTEPLNTPNSEPLLLSNQDMSPYISETPATCTQTLIILDDAIDSGAFATASCTELIAERGRHFNLSCIVSSQRINKISTNIRDNSDIFIIFSLFTIQEFERYIEQFMPRSMRREIYPKLLMLLGEVPHRFLLIDNSIKTAMEKMFYGVAQELDTGLHPVKLYDIK